MFTCRSVTFSREIPMVISQRPRQRPRTILARARKQRLRDDMFAGEFRCNVDDKGRFVLPTTFRVAFPVEDGQLVRGVILLKSLDHSLWLYRVQEWEEKLTKTRQHLDDEQSRLFMHYVVAESAPSEVDKNGRISIPKRLRDYS